jgi:GR25 family glycosyltransferase involved in LPS biosynthesis
MLTAFKPLGAHIVGLTILSWLYIGWAYVGYVVTDKYAWWFLDHKQVDWRYVVASWAGFAALTQICEHSLFLA